MSHLPFRSECSTVRVQSGFGSLYLHVDHAEGQLKRVHISHPQKHEDTAVGRALESLALALSSEIRTLAETWKGAP